MRSFSAGYSLKDVKSEGGKQPDGYGGKVVFQENSEGFK